MPAPAHRTASDGVFTAEQAKRGAGLYEANCARCHLSNLKGNETAPPLTGDQFLAAWAGKPLRALYSAIVSTMPQDSPGSIDPDDALDLVACILEANGLPAGPTRLASAEDAEGITITRPD